MGGVTSLGAVLGQGQRHWLLAQFQSEGSSCIKLSCANRALEEIRASSDSDMLRPDMFHALVASFSCFSLVGIPIAAIQIYFGASALDNCPIQPMIPKWLVGEFHLNTEYARCYCTCIFPIFSFRNYMAGCIHIQPRISSLDDEKSDKRDGRGDVQHLGLIRRHHDYILPDFARRWILLPVQLLAISIRKL